MLKKSKQTDSSIALKKS